MDFPFYVKANSKLATDINNKIERHPRSCVTWLQKSIGFRLFLCPQPCIALSNLPCLEGFISRTTYKPHLQGSQVFLLLGAVSVNPRFISTHAASFYSHQHHTFFPAFFEGGLPEPKLYLLSDIFGPAYSVQRAKLLAVVRFDRPFCHSRQSSTLHTHTTFPHFDLGRPLRINLAILGPINSN